MHQFAYWTLLFALLAMIFGSGSALIGCYNSDSSKLSWLERLQWLAAILISLSSAVLFVALYTQDYSFLYVAEYTDNTLPLFYTLTAFWAGQAGSFLFWAWMIAIFGALFSLTPAYRGLSDSTKLYYWLFYLAIEAFFLFILTGPSNPFLKLVPAVPDGKGLNPLLQNPGMIFHPPLLFLGYAGYTIPCCLGLAAWLSGEDKNWLALSRNAYILSWSFLTAGIVLGGWWSYMELGWGGYWAWDPVENASLIPWLSGTAFLHTALIGMRKNALGRTNVMMAALTLILCFFGTYLVRSGVIESLHAFGEGGVSRPLLLFVFWCLAVSLAVTFAVAGDYASKPLSGLISLPGLLIMLTWLMLALGAVVFLGTMWPVISKLWSENPVGLDAGFYNKVCTPLFALVCLIIAFCPFMSWGEGARNKKLLTAVAVVLAGSGLAFFAAGFSKPVALLGAASSVAALAAIVLLFVSDKASRTRAGGLGAYLTHAGLALVVLGVAFSGPYQETKEAVLATGQSLELGRYKLTNQGLKESNTPAMAVAGAPLTVEKDGKPYGELNPERRLYRNFEQPFSEVSVIPSFGDELYATLMGFTKDGSASFKISVNPLVNWIWIGGALMCLASLLCLRRASRK